MKLQPPRPVVLIIDDTADAHAMLAQLEAMNLQADKITAESKGTIKLNQSEVIIKHSTNGTGRETKRE